MLLYEGLSNQIVGSFIKVHSALGPGLLESCYHDCFASCKTIGSFLRKLHNALYFKLKSLGLSVGYNAPYNVVYRGEVVGEFFADLAVEGKVIIEIKAVKALSAAHEAQLLNYLHISGCRLGYLVNFQGSRVVWKRFVV